MGSLTPVLEVGGTHVSAALVDANGWTLGETTRLDLDADADADGIVGRFLAAGNAAGASEAACWGVAMPDPFDYDTGVALFEGVGKFAALHGVDVGAALAAGLQPRPAAVRFVNDADAFVLGEWAAGSGRGVRRLAGITLGTGIGSGWLVDGTVVDPGTPAGGRAHRLQVRSAPLEDVVSRRAIRRAYAAAGGDADADVREIAERARQGCDIAVRVLDAAFTALGEALAGPLARFGAEVVVIGGSMAASWELFEPSVRAGAGGTGLPEIRLAAASEDAPLIGAALHARRSPPTR